MRRRGAGNLGQRGLHAQRLAAAVFQHQHGLGHQQAQAVLFAGHRGQQHPRCGTGAELRQAGDGLAQEALRDLGVQVFLEHVEPCACPGLADRVGQGADDLGGEAAQAQPRQQPAQAVAQQAHVMGAQQVEQRLDLHRRQVMQAMAPGLRRRGLRQLLQRFQGQPHDAARPLARVEQALHDAQLVQVSAQVAALAGGIALRRGEAVAPLPDAQGVLAQAGIALDGADRQSRLLRLVHAGVPDFSRFCPRHSIANLGQKPSNVQNAIICLGQT